MFAPVASDDHHVSIWSQMQDGLGVRSEPAVGRFGLRLGKRRCATSKMCSACEDHGARPSVEFVGGAAMFDQLLRWIKEWV
jgi:hypothetical protein